MIGEGLTNAFNGVVDVNDLSGVIVDDNGIVVSISVLISLLLLL